MKFATTCTLQNSNNLYTDSYSDAVMSLLGRGKVHVIPENVSYIWEREEGPKRYAISYTCETSGSD